MKNLFVAASGIFSAIPGLAIMWKGIGCPPNLNYNYIFGGTVEAFGALALIILLVNKNKIKRISITKVTKYAIYLSLLCFFSLVIYISIYNFCVVKHSSWGTVYYPLWTSGEIAAMIENAGGRYAAIGQYGIADIIDEINNMPNSNWVLAITTTILLLVYQAIFTSLTIAFGLLGFRQGKDFESN